MENTQAAPTPQETFKGEIALEFQPGQTLISFCEKIFGTFNADDHEPVALRLYHGKETFITLYALDKVRQEISDAEPGKIPVRKFKKEISSLQELVGFVQEFNLTLSAGNFPLEDMRVINR